MAVSEQSEKRIAAAPLRAPVIMACSRTSSFSPKYGVSGAQLDAVKKAEKIRRAQKSRINWK